MQYKVNSSKVAVGIFISILTFICGISLTGYIIYYTMKYGLQIIALFIFFSIFMIVFGIIQTIASIKNRCVTVTDNQIEVRSGLTHKEILFSDILEIRFARKEDIQQTGVNIYDTENMINVITKDHDSTLLDCENHQDLFDELQNLLQKNRHANA